MTRDRLVKKNKKIKKMNGNYCDTIFARWNQWDVLLRYSIYTIDIQNQCQI